MHLIDGPGATPENAFTEGNPAAGVAPTQVTAAWANMLQLELFNVLAAAGIDPDKEDNAQLVAAIQEIIAAQLVAIGPASTTEAGIVELATSAEVVAGTDTERAATPAGVKAAIAASGVSLETILLYS